MQSSNNSYLSNLDHMRGLAAFMVFLWHFTHFRPGCLQNCGDVQYSALAPFFSWLEQGHTGVALFMCISGYIFTYLIDRRHVHIGKFWANRILRLFPLLLFWGFCESIGLWDAGTMSQITTKLFNPDLSWTIYIELQYYLAFPVLLMGLRAWGPRIILVVLGVLLAYRFGHWLVMGTVRDLSYWTIVGRADQFLLGTGIYYVEQWLKQRNPGDKKTFRLIGLAGLAGICALYHYIHLQGGLQNHDEAFSNSVLWVFLPTLEGLFYSLMIIAYLQFSIPRRLDHMLSTLGRWSYSIYLGHIQIIPFLVIFAATRVGMPEDFYYRLVVAILVAFPFVMALSALTYRLIEKPFLRLRRNYMRTL